MARDIALASTDFKVVVENGERTERERALATAESLLAKTTGSLPVNRLVNALGLLGIDQDVARGAIKDLARDGRLAVSAGLAQAS